MSPRSERVVAIAALTVAVAATATTAVMERDQRYHGATWNEGAWQWAAVMFTAVAFGAVMTLRRSGRPERWLFLAAGLAGALGALFDHVGVYLLLVRDAPVASAAVFAHASSVGLLVPWALLGIVVPLYFPSGRLLSTRWRGVVGLGVFSALAVLLAEAFASGPLYERTELPRAPNPLGDTPLSALSGTLELGYFGLFGGMILAAVALVIRLHRSAGVERQQLKWVAFTVVVALFTGLAAANLNTLLGPDHPAVRVLSAVQLVGYLGIPVSIAIAMLRFRLYDIDVIIRRTLVYALLTAVLVAVYAVLAAGLGMLLRGVAQQESSAAVAVSTLVVAALFRPVRERAQEVVDRRFYRARYDARRTVEAFSARLRERVELDAVVAELISVVRGTLQPSSLSYWLREPERRQGLAPRPGEGVG